MVELAYSVMNGFEARGQGMTPLLVKLKLCSSVTYLFRG